MQNELIICRLAIVLGLGGSLVRGQVEEASLTGLISDRSGAAVPGAQLSAENLALV